MLGFLRVGGYSLARVGYCGGVNIGHGEDLEPWLTLECHVIAILVPVTKSELIEEGLWSEVLIFGRGMDSKNVGVWYLCRLASTKI